MGNNIWEEIVIAVGLLGLLGLLLNPWQIWMPSAAIMAVLVGVVAVFALFVSIVWREQARDEREHLHQHIAGRVAFLTGAVVALLGITVQSLTHQLDPWLLATFAVMILAKASMRVYVRVKN